MTPAEMRVAEALVDFAKAAVMTNRDHWFWGPLLRSPRFGPIVLKWRMMRFLVLVDISVRWRRLKRAMGVA